MRIVLTQTRYIYLMLSFPILWGSIGRVFGSCVKH